MDFDGKGNVCKEQIKLTENRVNLWTFVYTAKIFNKSLQCLSAACLSMFHHTVD